MSRAKRVVTAKEKKLLKEEIKQITKQRKEKGLTQKGLAKLMGRSASNVGNMESGFLLPNKEWIDRAKAALNLKIDKNENKEEKVEKVKGKQKKSKTNSSEPKFKASKSLGILARSLISSIANELLKKDCK